MEKELHTKTIFLCSTIIFAVASVFWDKLFLFLPIFLIGIIFGFYKKYFGKIFPLILIIIFTLSYCYANYRKPSPDILYFYNGQNVIITGNILSLPDKTSTNKTKFIFKVNSIIDEFGNKRDINAKTQVYLDEKIQNIFSRGDSLRLNSHIIIPESYHNPNEFDYAKYLANSDIYTMSFAQDVEIINSESSLTTKVLRYIDKIREKILITHSKYLNKEKTEILGGVVFGSEAIKPSVELKTTFIESGLYHLLAASGMNVAFIFGIWFFLLIRFRAPYRFIIVSGGIVVFLYAIMTGLPPSVTRATWMLELGLFAKLLDRKADNNVILLFVCAILLLYNPKLINDIGFLLSFMVTFGLLTCANPIMERIKFLPAKVSGWIVIPFIAQIFAIPIQMYYFQTISVYSIIANILVVPFMAIISFCGFVSSILSLIPKVGTYLCFILDKINEPFLSFMLFVAQVISAIPNNIAHVAKLNYIEILLYYILVFLFIYMLKNSFKNIKVNIVSIVILISLIFSFCAKTYSNDLSITFLSVGEADSIFISTPNKKHLLIDTGKNYGKTRNSATTIIIPFLKMLGIIDLDALILTHPDSDHIAGSVDILENLNVKQIITNGEKAENKSYKRLQTYMQNNNKSEDIINKPKEISPDKDVSIIAFTPKNTNKKSQNDTSIILLIKYKDFDGILMGDNEINSYNILKENLKPSGDIELFKVGHHGSKNSINKKMSELISPNVSVISVGKNSYGHPHPRVLSQLRSSKIYRTDMDNTVKIKTNGKDFQVYTYNSEKNCWINDKRKP